MRMSLDWQAQLDLENEDALHEQLTLEATAHHMTVQNYLAWLEKKELETAQDDSWMIGATQF